INLEKELFDSAKSFQQKLPRKGGYRSKPNFAYAKLNVDIDLPKNEFYAHSSIFNISQFTDPQVQNRLSDISILPTNKLFDTWYVSNDWKLSETPVLNDSSFWDRECDSEFKILNEIAELLGNNYDTKGSLQLYTQLYCC